MLSATVLAALVGLASAAKDSRTFAVLHFYGDGALTTCREDPIVSPGVPSGHLHTIMGGNNFNMNATGESMRQSSCTNSLLKSDLSAYWAPTLFFQDPNNGSFEQVPLFYMNVYYFFEATNDDITAFPLGLQMVSGNAQLRTVPVTTGELQLDPSQGTIQPTQWTCPRSNFNPPSWPVGSLGTDAGIQDPGNQGSGMGFPFQECDGYASPLRMDLHFPSCYNPAAGLTNYKENMQFPTAADGGKQDCPPGWIHTPHIFFEVYWNTPLFQDRWDVNGNSQPFISANGDRTGFSSHGDFIAAWDETVLQQIIDNCDAGDSGMDKCPGLLSELNDPSSRCNIECGIDEPTTGILSALPGDNPPAGWGVGNVDLGAGGGTSNPSTAAAPPPASSSLAAASSVAAAPTVVNNAPAPSSSTDEETQPAAETTQPAAEVTQPAAETTQTVAAVTTAVVVPSTTVIALPGGGSFTSTIWETETVWMTTTVYEDSVPAPSTATATATATVSASASSLPAVDGFTYAGCYGDDSGRVLAGEIRPDLGPISNTNCVAYCASKGWSLAGTEYGGQCYCGDSLTTVTLLDVASCDMACEGAAGEMCGGSWALTLYTANGTQPVSKRQARSHLMRHRRSSHVRRS